ncbi:MAG: AAA family ATPase [Planctomycetota bacterium]|jgi:MoxR-like ATPase
MSVRERVEGLGQAMSRSIIGQEQVVERLLVTLLCNGNVLLEGLPGLAKTRAIKALARNLEAAFSRIQFTPDLLPSDITGTEMYLGEEATERFEFRPGPIFANIVLADEINRAPAKVQAALLEAMEERQVTVAGTTHRMADLFMVMATQNPIEQEGTYPLPEAQMDRFLMHVMIDYPRPDDEVHVLRLVRGEEGAGGGEPSAAIPPEVVFDARREIGAVHLAENVERYIVDLVNATRSAGDYDADAGRWITVGASPRGGIALDKCARAHAWLRGRDRVLPEDVQAVAHDCLRHRLALSYEAGADGVTADDVLARLLTLVAVA